MKLLHHITYKFLLVTVITLSLCGTALYYALKELVEEEMTEQLDLQAEMIAMELKDGRVVTYPLSIVHRTSIGKPERIIKDTLVFDRVQNKYEDYRALSVIKKVNDTYYRIEVMTTFIGWKKYLSTIFYLLLLTALIMTAAGIVFNYLLSRRIWQPFFHNLQALKNYSLSDPDISLAESPISEFKEMQEALQSMITQSRREYLSLREFTENASHEIQTPLSIVRAKLEKMTQLPVTEELAAYIVQAKSGIDRLSRINKDLLLLVKLENGVFSDKTDIFLEKEVARHMVQMEELYQNRNIEPEISLDYQVPVSCNQDLTDILISNLLTNALQYTPKGGDVKIMSAHNAIIIKNIGPPLPFPAEHIFDRFKKGNQHESSNGLGLSIVRQISRINQWAIRYTYEEGWHVLTILVSSETP